MRLDEGSCVFGAGVLLKHLTALESQIEGVREGRPDIEHVHDARVASRRLRAALPLFIGCLPSKKARKWLDGIRRVTRALGEARDTDVQIEWLQKFSAGLADKKAVPGIQRLMLRLRQKREKLQAPLVEAMDALPASALIPNMTARLQPLADRSVEVYVYTPTLYRHSFQAISTRLDALLAFDEIVEQPDKVTELHQMRIAAKWLRYTLETFAPLYASQLQAYIQAVKTMQDLLGEIHDCDVWQQFLPTFLEEEHQRVVEYFGSDRAFKPLVAGIQSLEQDRLQERGSLYEKFVENWRAWQSAGLFNDLRGAIQVPFQQIGQVYPPLSPRPEGPSAV